MNGDVTVRDVMAREYVGVSEADGVLETVELLLEEDTSCAVVLRGSDAVGLLTQRDVLRLLVEGGDPMRATVEEAMTDNPDVVGPDHTIAEAADTLSAADTHRLLVLDGDEVVGVLTERDLLAAATIEPEASGFEEAPPAMEVEAAEVTATTAEAGGGYSSQSICEGCGALTRELVDVNGQHLCADCRDI